MDNSTEKSSTGFNRRNLFKTGLILAGGAMLPAACKTSAGVAGSSTQTSKAKVFSRRKLGGALEVSSIGLGVQNMPRTYQTLVQPGAETFATK
jgi:hypothetical protein